MNIQDYHEKGKDKTMGDIGPLIAISACTPRIISTHLHHNHDYIHKILEHQFNKHFGPSRSSNNILCKLNWCKLCPM